MTSLLRPAQYPRGRVRSARLSALVAATLLVVIAVAGCGDDGDEPAGVDPSVDESVGPDAADIDGIADADTGPDAVEAGVDGPVQGALVSILSFDQGFLALDRDSGAVRRIELDGVGFTDRNQPAVLGADATAWVLGYSPVDGQSFTNAAAVARVDLAAASGAALVDLGQDRADDDDPNAVTWRIVGATSERLWVEERLFGEIGFTLLGFDPVSGDEVARQEFAGDDAPANLLLVGDTIVAQANGDIVTVDPETGQIEVVVTFFNGVSLGDVIDPDDIGAYVITADGSPPEPADIESISLFGEPRPNRNWVSDGTSIWWVFDGIRTLERGTAAVYGGLVRFDPATAVVTGSWPLGERYASFEDDTTWSSMSQAELAVRDGVVWLADVRDDGELVRIDPASGAVTGVLPERGADIDYTRLEMVPTDADAVWVRVTRWVITDTDADGTSASGTSTIERVDPATGRAVVTVSEAEIE